jgi:ribosome-binding protein aMBF1 (putative translation factor)
MALEITRVSRGRPLTPEEIAEDQRIVEAVRAEIPEMLAQAAAGEGFNSFEDATAVWQLVAALRTERERQGLSLAEISQRSQLAPELLAELEQSQLPMPPINQLMGYARVLGLQLNCSLQVAPTAAEAAR